MHVYRSRAALVSFVVLIAGSASASLAACATGGSSSASGGDASADTGVTPFDSSSGPEASCSANLQTDWMNCGSCGHLCATGDICNAGQCQAPCNPPTSVCTGKPGCFDLTSDVGNCGTCGNACPAATGGTVPGTATCVQSQCGFTCPTSVVVADAGPPDGGATDGGGEGGASEAGASDGGAGSVAITQCAGDSGTPGCFDLTSSADHCGSCDTPCPANNVCTESHCCPAGNAYCGGMCIDVATDPANCGTCNAACPLPAQCSAGVCTGYTTSNPTIAFIDACAQATKKTVLVNDFDWEFTTLLTLPFTFDFYGTSQTQFWLASEGTMGIGAPKGVFGSPDGYPACGGGGMGDPTLKYAAIVAFGDMDLATGSAGVCYATLGTAPNQQLVATWKDTNEEEDSDSVLTFSVVLTQTTNTVDFMYETASGPDGGIDAIVSGVNATVGMQAYPGGTLVDTPISCNATFFNSTPYVIRLTPVP